MAPLLRRRRLSHCGPWPVSVSPLGHPDQVGNFCQSSKKGGSKKGESSSSYFKILIVFLNSCSNGHSLFRRRSTPSSRRVTFQWCRRPNLFHHCALGFLSGLFGPRPSALVRWCHRLLSIAGCFLWRSPGVHNE